jgi:hypothetical protein
MIRSGFLSAEDRRHLIALVRNGSAASRLTRRANALVLLDDGWSCQEIAAAFLLNDDTIRGWHKLFEQRGVEGLTSFDVGGGAREGRRSAYQVSYPKPYSMSPRRPGRTEGARARATLAEDQQEGSAPVSTAD